MTKYKVGTPHRRKSKTEKPRWNASVQSLIDHIKTAVDVDPWAKEMAEELLKDQEGPKQHWLKQIADTQYLNAPGDWQSEDQKLYSQGVYDGLQIAWDIITEKGK